MLVLSLAGFTPYLNEPDIVTSHEARVALPAREMAASGWPLGAKPSLVPPVKLRPGVVRLAPDWEAPPMAVNPWLVPVMSGQIRLQKPPLPYWCAAICFRIAGGFSEGAVRFVPALLGALAVLLVYDLGHILYGRRVGWIAGLIWVSTYTLPDEYRKAMADPYLAFFTLACVWCWIRAMDARRASLWIVGFYISFAVALLAKGPPAFVDILLPIAVFHACTRKRPQGGIWAHVIGAALMLAIALPWPTYVWKSVPHALELWRYESVGEMTDNTENARPGWFYLPQMLYMALPWTAVWGLGIARQLFRAREVFDAWMRRRLLEKDGIAPSNTGRFSKSRGKHFFPIIWYALTIIFFSFVHLKKNQYLLPMLPAQTLLIAQGFAVMLAGLHHRKFTGPPGWLAWLQTIVGIVFSIAVVGLVCTWGHAHVIPILLSLIAVIVTLLPLLAIFRGREWDWTVRQTIAFVVLIIVFGRVFTAPNENDRSAKQVAGEVLALSNQPNHTLLAMRLPEEVAVYLPLAVQYDVHAEHVLMIVDDQHGMHMRQAQSGKIAIPQPDFRGIFSDAQVMAVERIALKSAPGDARWKVWDITVDRPVLPRQKPTHFAGSVAGAVAGNVAGSDVGPLVDDSDAAAVSW